MKLGLIQYSPVWEDKEKNKKRRYEEYLTLKKEFETPY